MAQAIFIVDTPHEQYLPSNAELGTKDGNGWWIVPETVAPLPNTVCVIVDTSEEFMDVMAAQTDHWIYIDEVDNETQTA